MPDMLLYSQPSKADNYSRKLYQAELAWDKNMRIYTIKKLSYSICISNYDSSLSLASNLV